MENPNLAILMHDLETQGCVIRVHLREVEVWGADISEHYTISLSPSQEATDVIYLGASDLKPGARKRKQWLG